MATYEIIPLQMPRRPSSRVQSQNWSLSSSHRCLKSQRSPCCLAQMKQQLHPSRMMLTPPLQCNFSSGRWQRQGTGQSLPFYNNNNNNNSNNNNNNNNNIYNNNNNDKALTLEQQLIEIIFVNCTIVIYVFFASSSVRLSVFPSVLISFIFLRSSFHQSLFRPLIRVPVRVDRSALYPIMGVAMLGKGIRNRGEGGGGEGGGGDTYVDRQH